MATASEIESVSSTYGASIGVTLSGANTAGRYLVALLSERSGETAAHTYGVSNTEGAFTKVFEYRSPAGDADNGSFRHGFSIWVYGPTTASTPNLQTGTVDGGTGSVSGRMTVLNFEASEEITWSVDGFSRASTEDEASPETLVPLSSGNTASLSAGDRVLVGFGCCRNSTDEPTTGNVTMSGFGSNLTEYLLGNNSISHWFDWRNESTGGTKSTGASWNGSGNEAASIIVAIGLSSGGGGGGGGRRSALSGPFAGPFGGPIG